MYSSQKFGWRLGQAGLSLVELVMFIVIVGVGLAGTLSVMDTATRGSADPLLRKQGLAIAEAILEEVSLMPFTTCDPDDFDPSTRSCPVGQEEQMGPETGEARGSLMTPFDNVNDYNGFSLAGGGGDIGGGASVVVPTGYTANVAVTQDGGLGPSGAVLSQNDVLRITVTVTINSTGEDVVLDGYSTRLDP